MADTDLSDLTPEDPGTNNIPFSKGSSWGATTKAKINASIGAEGVTFTTGFLGDLTPNTMAVGATGLFLVGTDALHQATIQLADPALEISTDGVNITHISMGQDVIMAAGKTLQHSDDVDWTAVTYNTGWVDLGSPYQTTRYCKRRGIVFIEGYGHRTSGSETTIFTLPDGCRPAAQLSFKTNSSAGPDYLAQVAVGSDGTVATQTGEDKVGLTLCFYVG